MSVCSEMRGEGEEGAHVYVCPQEYSCEYVVLCVKHSHVSSVFGIFMECMSECLGSVFSKPPYGCVSLCALGFGVPLNPCGCMYLSVSVCTSVCTQIYLRSCVRVGRVLGFWNTLVFSLHRSETSWLQPHGPRAKLAPSQQRTTPALEPSGKLTAFSKQGGWGGRQQGHQGKHRPG